MNMKWGRVPTKLNYIKHENRSAYFSMLKDSPIYRLLEKNNNRKPIKILNVIVFKAKTIFFALSLSK